ncbi:Gfo/Idh/MocA family protein [Winogradskyella endarachnes]|uniref:Gfo/Idh/MocA family protein n=1 Tax=Winogradskyella endarachnes TaxID=2681965 RepID=UPI00293C0E02|nr:Gfo/Idh/MocA family oxidoreductase [Winogradskyella endarachnes]
MTSKIINWGIIGAGKIATKFATDLNTVPNCNFYAIASRTIEKADSFKKLHHANVAYGSYAELIADNNIDAIYIATPHSFHNAHTALCLNHKNLYYAKNHSQ